jgi:signal transduction histidine kinase/ligand-binding sensor domain-containing protein
MISRSVIVLVFFFGLIHCHAQTRHPFSPDQSLKDLSIAQWTASDGLSSNNITSIFQSADGLLWVTSFNGFMHFDAERTELFDRSNLRFLSTDGFYIAIQDSKGKVWLGSQGSGIVAYDSGSYKLFVPTSGTTPLSIRTLSVAKNDDILVGTSNAGFYRIHNNTIIQVHHPHLDKSTVMGIVEDNNGTLWVATDGEGLFSINGDVVNRFTTKDGLATDAIAAIKFRRDGGLWIGTNRGLQLMMEGKFTAIESMKGAQINALYIDEWNSLWIGTERGLGRLDEKNNDEWIYSKNNIDFVRISHISQDREGNIWIASNRSGIIRLKETNITNITRPALSSDRANIVTEGPDGRYYIGTDMNQVDVCESGNCKPLVIKTPVGGNGIRDIYVMEDGDIWLATYLGIIHRKKNGSEIVYNEDKGMPAEDFRVIHRDRNGTFWFGSRSGGLVKFRDGKIEHVFDHSHGLQSNYILSVVEDKEGNIYVGTHSGGMSVISPEGKVQTYHVRADDAGILIFNVDIDMDGRVWLMANIGPLYFDGTSIRAIELQADVKSKTYFDWIDDQLGNMWITTSIGMLQLKKADVLLFINKEIDKVAFQLRDDSDGMNNKECTGATRSTLSRDHHVLVPTLGGICEINPSNKKETDIIPPVHISHFLADNEEQDLVAPLLKVKPGTLRYTFQYRVHSYVAPERNKFRYILENVDKEWSEPTLLGEVEYTNLSPGTYTFKVIGSNGNNVWNDEGASIKFQVLPFFYQTAWFYVVLVFIVLFILYGLYRWRISFIREQNLALRKVNAELDRFVYSASHDLRSPLSSILGLISVARADKENQGMYMDLMEKSVKKLDSFIRDIIEFSRNARLEVSPERIDFEKMFNDILDDLHFMDNYDKIKKTMNVRVDVPFNSDAKRLRVVLSNIVANAIKHHLTSRRDPSLDIRVSQNGNAGVVIEVSDNGPGIPPEHLENIFKMFFRATDRTSGSGLGLYIVKETVHRLNGEVTVTSQLDKGTTFTIALPSLPIANQ